MQEPDKGRLVDYNKALLIAAKEGYEKPVKMLQPRSEKGNLIALDKNTKYPIGLVGFDAVVNNNQRPSWLKNLEVREPQADPPIYDSEQQVHIDYHDPHFCNGRTALMLATQEGHQRIVELLLKSYPKPSSEQRETKEFKPKNALEIADDKVVCACVCDCAVCRSPVFGVTCCNVCNVCNVCWGSLFRSELR